MDVDVPCLVIHTVSAAPALLFEAEAVGFGHKVLRCPRLFGWVYAAVCRLTGARPTVDLAYTLRVDGQTVVQLRRSDVGLAGSVVTSASVQLPLIGPCRRSAYMAGRRDVRHELANVGFRPKFVQPQTAFDKLLPNVG